MSRRRYRYDKELGEMVEIGADWTDAERKAPHLTEGVAYSNLTATDGTVLDTRKKHREYMKAHGLTMASDFTNYWEKKAKERADFFEGRTGHEGLKEALVKAYDQVMARRKR